MEEKKCSKCKKKKLVEEFYKNKSTKDGYHHYCKKCHCDDNKNRYATNPVYRENMRFSNIKYQYGLSLENYNDMLNTQNNVCSICKNDFKTTKTTHVDHNHKTGNVRGILCSKCNNLLGMCNDDIQLLESAINYLKKPSWKKNTINSI